MSQLTLFDEDIPDPADVLNEKNYYAAAPDLERGEDFDMCTTAKKSVTSLQYADVCGGSDCDSDSGLYSDDRVLYEGEFEKPQIHLLKLGDTMRSICKMYNVSVSQIAEF